MSSTDLFNVLQQGIEDFRLYGTRAIKKPVANPILEDSHPNPHDRRFLATGESIGIPGYQLEALMDFILHENDGYFLNQMTDILLQAKLAYDGDEIRRKEAEFEATKQTYQDAYNHQMMHYERQMSRIREQPRPMEKTIRILIDESKKFDPNLPFTGTMLGIVATLHKFSGSPNVPGKCTPERYKPMLESMDWDKVEELVLLDDVKQQNIVSTAKGIACQVKHESVFHVVPLPEVIHL